MINNLLMLTISIQSLCCCCCCISIVLLQYASITRRHLHLLLHHWNNIQWTRIADIMCSV